MSAKKITMGAKPTRAPEQTPVDAFVSAGAETPATAPAGEPAKMKRLTIDVDADLHRRLKVACAQDGRKMADFLRDLIAKNLP